MTGRNSFKNGGMDVIRKRCRILFLAPKAFKNQARSHFRKDECPWSLEIIYSKYSGNSLGSKQSYKIRKLMSSRPLARPQLFERSTDSSSWYASALGILIIRYKAINVLFMRIVCLRLRNITVKSRSQQAMWSLTGLRTIYFKGLKCRNF